MKKIKKRLYMKMNMNEKDECEEIYIKSERGEL